MARDSLNSLQKRVIAFCEARDWGQFHSPKDLALSLVLEASEVMEHFQWKSPQEIKKYIRTNKTEIGEELADVLYWVLLISHNLNIDLPTAFVDKLKKNETKYPVKKSKGKHTKYTKL